jgi:hypothetical protein
MVERVGRPDRHVGEYALNTLTERCHVIARDIRSVAHSVRANALSSFVSLLCKVVLSTLTTVPAVYFDWLSVVGAKLLKVV